MTWDIMIKQKRIKRKTQVLSEKSLTCMVTGKKKSSYAKVVFCLFLCYSLCNKYQALPTDRHSWKLKRKHEHLSIKESCMIPLSSSMHHSNKTSEQQKHPYLIGCLDPSSSGTAKFEKFRHSSPNTSPSRHIHPSKII